MSKKKKRSILIEEFQLINAKEMIWLENYYFAAKNLENDHNAKETGWKVDNFIMDYSSWQHLNKTTDLTSLYISWCHRGSTQNCLGSSLAKIIESESSQASRHRKQFIENTGDRET